MNTNPGSSEPQSSTRALSTALLVDDTPQNLALLGDLLQPHFRVRVANSGERALRAASGTPRPDIILLDVMMPDMDGHEVLRRLRADPLTRDIPVIFVTAMDGSDDEATGLELGAVDYITKPINPAIVLARVRTHLELKQARDRLSDQNAWLERELARRLRDNLAVQDLSIRALASLAEARDNETGRHIIRTQRYVELMGNHLSGHPRFTTALSGSQLERIVKAAPLHDIGKVGIPDAILLKPGPLTAAEFTIMKTHPTIGAEAIRRAMADSGSATETGMVSVAGEESPFAFLGVAHEIAYCHHEKWDGSGYPRGLAGEAIPVSARLMALADVFDALMTRRVYKPPFSLEETTHIIVEGRDRHFDGAVVDAFLACRDEFARIAAEMAD